MHDAWEDEAWRRWLNDRYEAAVARKEAAYQLELERIRERYDKARKEAAYQLELERIRERDDKARERRQHCSN